MIRTIFTLLLLLFFVTANAQQKDKDPKPSKETKKHNEKKAKSKNHGKGVVSMDTLFCSGKPYCLAKEVSHNLLGTVTEYSLRAFKKGAVELVKINLESVSSGPKAVYYWVWVGDNQRFETDHKEFPLDLVCYYSIFNDSALTIKYFNTLKTAKAKVISGYNGKPAPKPGDDNSANRNREDKISISGRDIRQSSVLIGHIESNTNSKNGSIVTTILVYNAAGNLVATSQNKGVADHNWTITTSGDKRTHAVNSSLLHDQEDVVTYLVKLFYL